MRLHGRPWWWGNELAAALSTLNTTVTSLNFEGIRSLEFNDGGDRPEHRTVQLLCAWIQEAVDRRECRGGVSDSGIGDDSAEVSLANRAEQAAAVALNPLFWGVDACDRRIGRGLLR